MFKESDQGSSSFGQESYSSHSLPVVSSGGGTAVEQRAQPGKTGTDNPRDLVNTVTSNPHYIASDKSISGYRVSLSRAATSRERKLFIDYQKEVTESGWSLIYVDPRESEEAAYIATRKGSADEMSVATAVAKIEFKRALEEAYGSLR